MELRVYQRHCLPQQSIQWRNGRGKSQAHSTAENWLSRDRTIAPRQDGGSDDIFGIISALESAPEPHTPPASLPSLTLLYLTPQLSKRRPSGESSVCEVTGQHTIGHVHLGARQGGVNGGGGGGSAQEMSGGAPDISWQQPEDEEDEAVRPMGEPQLTTCTDR